MQETIAYGTMIVTLGLVLSRPRIVGFHVGPAGAGMLAVVVLMATGVVAPANLADGFDALWRPSLTIFSLMLTTNVAQRLGLLDELAGRSEPRPGQDVAKVFRSVFVLSAATSAVLNNDAAVLLLTPLIVALVRGAYPDRPDLVVPFAFAVFSAAGVAPLVISNPMNLVVAEYAGIGFNEYAARMIPIALAGWVTAYVILRAVFQRQLRAAGPVLMARAPRPGLSRAGKQFLALLAVTLGCYPALSYAGGPIWLVALASATLAVLLSWAYRLASPLQLAAAVSWDILVFLFCAFIVVLGLRNVGLVDQIADLYGSAGGPAWQVGLIGVSSALGSALLNNHPMAIVNALAISQMPGGTQQHILAALIGGDLGPRLLPMGSLAGLLWLDSLRRQGVQIGLFQFMFVGALVTIPTLVISLGLLLTQPD